MNHILRKISFETFLFYSRGHSLQFIYTISKWYEQAKIHPKNKNEANDNHYQHQLQFFDVITYFLVFAKNALTKTSSIHKHMINNTFQSNLRL